MRVSKKNWWRIGAVAAAIPAAVLVATLSGFFSNDDIQLVVDLSDRRLDLIENGEVVESYGIAVGTGSYPTPQGNFNISKIVWNPPWIPPDSDWARDEQPRAPGDPANPMQGVKLYFSEPAYFIHGTNDPGSIGSAASHGCIRMEKSEAESLARRLMERTGAGEDDDWFEKVTENPTDTYVVRLPRAVSLVIEG